MEADDFPRGPYSDTELDEHVDPIASRKKQKREPIRERHPLVSQIQTNRALVSFKLRSPGVKCLGMVTEVSERHLRVSLPNGTEETVVIEETSDIISVMCQEPSSSKESKRLRELHGAPRPLTEIFVPGQFVHGTYESSREAELHFSLKLSRFYDSVSLNRIPEGALITGCIRTVEDHGYMVTFSSKGASGFLSTSDVRKFYGDRTSLKPGQLIDAVVQSISARGVMQLTVNPEALKSSMVIEGGSIDQQMILPGDLVHAEIAEITDNGIRLSFMKSLGGIVTIFHLPQEEVSQDWQAAFCLRQVIKARVIAWDPESSEYMLSMKPFLANLHLPQMPAIIGQVFTEAVVDRADPNGLSLRLPADTGALFAYVFDESLSDLPVRSSDFKLKQTVSVRVTGFHALDGLIVGSMKESVIRSGIVCFDDIYPGLVAEGSVTRVRHAVVIVSMGEGIEGIARHCGISESVQLKHVFREGQLVWYRVLRVKSETRHVLLTLDIPLVHTQLPFLTSWDEAEVGQRVIGYVLAIKAAHIIVAFSADVHGVLSRDGIKLNTGESLTTCFQKNQVIKPWIRRYDSKKQAIYLTLIESQLQQLPSKTTYHKQPYKDICQAPPGLSVGDTAEAVIAKVLDRRLGYLISFETRGDQIKGMALLAVKHLADHPLEKRLIEKTAKEGTVLGNVIILETRDCVKASHKASLLKQASFLPKELGEIKEGMLIHGTVSFVGKEFLRVAFLDGLEGRVFRNQTVVPALAIFKQFSVGQSVLVRVIKVDLDRKRIQLTVNPSRISSCAIEFLSDAVNGMPSCQSSEFTREQIGTVMDVVVTQVDSAEAKCLVSGVKARIPRRHFGDDLPVTGAPPQSACFLDIDSDGVPVFSLKPYLVVRGFKPVKNLKKKKKTRQVLSTTATVEWIHDSYAMVSLLEDDHIVALVPLSDYNFQSFKLSAAVRLGERIPVEIPPHDCHVNGCRVVCTQLHTLLWKLDALQSMRDSGERRAFQAGDIVGGVVDEIAEGGIAVKLTTGDVGEARVTIPFNEAFDYFTDELPSILHPGLKISGVVIHCSTNSLKLSTRESEGGSIDSEVQLTDQWCPTEIEEGEIEKGMEMYGYVSGYGQSKNALFVNLARDMSGAVHHPHLNDDPVADVPNHFPLGSLVKGRVISCSFPKVGLSLRTGQKLLATHGAVLHGTVANSLPQGIYIAIDEAEGLQGLLPRYDLKPHISRSLKKGQAVSVRVNPLTDAYSLLLDWVENVEEIEIDEDMNKGEKNDMGAKVTHNEAMDFEMELAHAVEAEIETVADLSRLHEGDPSECQSRLNTGQIWGEENISMPEENKRSASRAEIVPDVKQEVAVEQKSEPETADDFEKRLLSQPNSSYLWIRYMAARVESDGTAAGRATAERALETIDFRMETERLNVWLARLNLERLQGTSTGSIMALFQKSILSNDSKKIHLSFLKVLERSQSREIGDQVLKSMQRRHPTSAKVFIQAIHYWLSTDRGGNCKRTLDLALKNLPRRKHLKVIQQTGILEFKIGKAERGRDLFETLISCYPKRMDVWNVYLDQELAQDDAEHIRSLFQRASSIDAGRKNMKWIFKRYLQFEVQHGTTQTIEHVKNKARDYITSKTTADPSRN